jgi:hypothetical protein
MRQPGAPLVRPLCHPNRQRPHAWVMGLDGRAMPFSGGGGRRGAVPRRESKRVRFNAGGGHQGQTSGGVGGGDPATVEPSMPARKAEHVDRQRAAVAKTLMPHGPCRPHGPQARPLL